MKLYLDTRSLNVIASDLDDLQLDGIITSTLIDSQLHQLVILDDEIFEKNNKVGELRTINSADDMTELMNAEFSNITYLMIETGDWHVIPLENLIAKFNKLDTQLLASASSATHIELLDNILELGVDICCLQVPDIENARELINKHNQTRKKLDLVSVTVTRVERVGTGDRVCVDTCSMLKPGEGLLVGSTAAMSVLVQAEVLESGFVNSRPFRINAGVVASYTMYNDKTKYLSELKAGSEVMVVDRQGYCRDELVARVKIERRPLILIKVKYKEREFPVLLQDAETVTLITDDGYIRVDKLVVGDKIMASIGEEGRHFGMAVNETVDER